MYYFLDSRITQKQLFGLFSMLLSCRIKTNQPEKLSKQKTPAIKTQLPKTIDDSKYHLHYKSQVVKF